MISPFLLYPSSQQCRIRLEQEAIERRRQEELQHGSNRPWLGNSSPEWSLEIVELAVNWIVLDGFGWFMFHTFMIFMLMSTLD
jgi:hypothetical protein